ncbi:MAG: SLC13/DASS family transporter [Phycisphaerae bacterium]|nr:SLC13/DASS family transporter [Phycisphaerae bacterium]
MQYSRRTIFRFGLVGVAAVFAVVLLVGPHWVEPIHPELGVPYAELPAEHPDYLDLPHRAPQRAMAVFVLCLGLWVSNVIPLPATSLLAVGLLPLFGVMPHAKAFEYFGNSAVFFILGVFILAAAMINTGLSKRLTLLFLHRFDGSPKRLIGGVLVCGAFFSLWMPEHAVAAMMFPLVVEVARALGLRQSGSVYARSLFLALAWGTVVGGVGTYLGGARAMLAVELYQKFYPDAAAPTFIEYASMTLPTVVIMTVVGFFVITIRAKPEIDSITQATRMLSVSVQQLGPLTGRERRLAGLMILTILAWIVMPTMAPQWLGYEMNLGVIALLSGVLVFGLRIAQWKDIQDYVNWGVIVMYGGAVALGAGLADTRAMDWLAVQLVPILSANRFLMLAAVAIAAVVLTESISNAAVVSVLLPVGFGLCHELNVPPLAMMYMVTIPAGLAYCLPMSSPPNAIAFSSGYYGIEAALRRGVWMMVLSIVVFLLSAWLYWPLVGLKL